MTDRELFEREEAMRELAGEDLNAKDFSAFKDDENSQEIEKERLERQDEVIREMSGEK